MGVNFYRYTGPRGSNAQLVFNKSICRWLDASGDNILQVQQKLQQCVKNISSWYKVNHLKINIDKTKVMLIGSKSQLKSLKVDDFILSYNDTPLELVENAKYLGMFINCDISWDFHVRRLCQSTYYHISLLRRLRRIFPMNLLLQVYIKLYPTLFRLRYYFVWL